MPPPPREGGTLEFFTFKVLLRNNCKFVLLQEFIYQRLLKTFFFNTLYLLEVAVNIKEPKAPLGVWGIVSDYEIHTT
jgi:hypothetical protein